MDLKFKNALGQFKDIDSAKGIVSGYLSVFNNKDSDGDIITPGAYTKTLSENKDRIKYYWQHDIRKPIGKFLELYEDTKGLAYTAQMSKASLGRDALIMMQEGIITENSVGFRIVQGKQMDDYYQINEIKLFEGSAVSLAANASARIDEVKSEEERQSELNSLVNSLEEFMRKSQGVSDEGYRMIEFQVARIKDLLSLDIEPPSHSKSNEPEGFDIDKFNNLLKIK